jgi:hypothetical protein
MSYFSQNAGQLHFYLRLQLASHRANLPVLGKDVVTIPIL